MRWWFRPSKQREADLEEEITHDLRLEAEERVRAGMPTAEAERASRQDFGNVLQVKEATRRAWTYEAEALRAAHIAYDLKHACRRFRRTPTFTVTALAVIALGIAANVAVFSIADAALLRPLAFPDPDRVIVFQTLSPNGTDTSASPVMYDHWRQQTQVFQDVSAYQHVLLEDTSGPTPEQLRASRVSADYFHLFGASVLRGRTFTAQEDRPDGPAVAVVSYGLWVRRFGGSADIGQTLRLNGQSYTIVGVLTAAFRGDDISPAPDAWLPLQNDPHAQTQGHMFSVFGRLRPGVTLDQARAQLQVSTADFRRAFPTALAKTSTFSVQPLRDAAVANVRPVLVMLLAAVVFVLLIACSNIANLLLLQGAGRRREFAVRAAIGAGRGRLLRQLLAESLLLAFGGGALGLAVGWLAMRLVLVPLLADVATVGLDWRVVAFTALVSVTTAVLFGLAPGLRLSRVELGDAMKSADERASRGADRRRIETMLVILQVSLAVVLLIGSALFMRTVAALTQLDAGFDPEAVLTMRASLSGPAFPTATQVNVVVQRGTEALQAVPGVVAVGASYGLPLESGGGLPFEIVGRPLPAGVTYHGGASWRAVAPGYFEALRIPVLHGRPFTDRDTQPNPAVVLINDVMRRRYWPNQDPIGQQLVVGHGVGPQFQDEPVRVIVGIVGNVRENRLEDTPGAAVYEPVAQLPDVANAFVASGTRMAWVVRTTTRPEAPAHTLQQTLQQAAEVPVSDVRVMDDIVSHSLLRQQLSARLMGGFGVAALVLAAIGLYGLVAYSVEQRIREIGIRLALGAATSQVKAMVLWQGMRLTVAGTLIGLVAALALTRLIARLLFGVPAWDPISFLVVPALVLTVAAVAASMPAWWASRVNPLIALKAE